MGTEHLPSGQALYVALENAERADLRFVGLTDDEALEFRREPTARFLARERTLRDIPLHPWDSESPAWWIGGGARPIVVIFRSGWQLRIDESPGFMALRRAIEEALHELAHWPALGADALPEASPCFFMAEFTRLDEWPVAPVVSEFAYIDAPGDWSMGHFGVRLYKQFDARALTMLDRHTLGSFQAMIDRQRGFDRKRLRGYTGPLVYPRKLLLAPRRRSGVGQ